MSIPADQLEALLETISKAVEEEDYYLSNGDPHTDYGDEWPEAAAMKANRLRLVADFVDHYGGWGGLIDQCRGLADDLEASA